VPSPNRSKQRTLEGESDAGDLGSNRCRDPLGFSVGGSDGTTDPERDSEADTGHAAREAGAGLATSESNRLGENSDRQEPDRILDPGADARRATNADAGRRSRQEVTRAAVAASPRGLQAEWRAIPVARRRRMAPPVAASFPPAN